MKHQPHRVSFASLAAALCCLVAVPAHAGRGLPPSSPEFPAVALGAPARGELAIRALGARLPATARAYGLTADELTGHLAHDRDLWVDQNGRLLYQCGLFIPAGAATATAEPVAAAAPYALDQTFLLHSKLGAKRMIYLDFDGHYMTNNAWTATKNGGNPINAPAWDTDGNPAVFGDAERTAIQQVWQRVAEDYAPFDVDVTTEYLGESYLTRSGSTDEYYGMRVLISPISSYFGAYGGIAYVGAFDDIGDYYKPALVFPERLANAEKYIGEAASHEDGHSLNLNHDGTTTGTEYYAGHGSGEVGWAPIMGVGYYQNLSQWSKGEYANANRTNEDDLAIIASYVGYRPDDHGNTAAAATILPAGTTLSASGFIERNTDVDVFRFATGAGSVSLAVNPAPNGPNLDVLFELRDANGVLLATANPATALSASLTTTLAAGTYYLHVRGTGYGDPLTTGYTNYGSLGQYTLSGTVVNPTGAIPPVAVATATPSSGDAPLTTTLSGTQSTDQDGTIVSYAWSFGDGGSGTGATIAHSYANPGTYTAVLTVTDNSGLTDTAAVTITVTAPNVPPVAVASATPTSGYAPLAVSFNGTGSYDPDGTISSYTWAFGDGTTGSGATPSHTYTGIGSYTAVLTVTDNRGATRTASVVIQTSQNPGNVVRVASITLTKLTVLGGKQVRAVVKITDPNNVAMSGATVTGTWSGVVAGTSTGTTDASGNVTLTSKKFRATGTVTFRVTNVTKTSYVYDPARNLITQASISAAPVP